MIRFAPPSNLSRRSVPLLAAWLAMVLATAASAQTVPSSTGETTSAPRGVAHGGATVETAPAARTKARAHRPARTHALGTASSGSSGSDSMTGAGSAAPGGPGSPPPTLPVGPGTAPSPKPGDTPGQAAFLMEVALVRT